MQFDISTERESLAGGDRHRRSLDPATLLTVQEVAAFLKVPVSWVYANLERKRGSRLPGYKIGKYWRFRSEEVFAWVKGNKA